ncbi:MAG: hybrid sensor histidine kinase/response regulator [Acidobacteriota bacterium]
MPSGDEALQKRLLATFKVEAREHIDTIASGLVDLERSVDNEDRTNILDTIFRSAHSLKGAARSVNLSDIESLCQALETAFAAMKQEKTQRTPELFDLFHRVVDALGQLLIVDTEKEPSSTRPPVSRLAISLQAISEGRHRPDLPTDSVERAADAMTSPLADRKAPAVASAETVRVSISKLDALLLQAEELLSAKLAVAHRAAQTNQLLEQFSEWRKKWGRLRSQARWGPASGNKTHSARQAETSSGFAAQLLDLDQEFLESFETRLVEVAKASEHDRRSVGAMVDALLEEMKKVVTQPFSAVLDVFPRFVRELSRDQGKEVELVIQGDEIEIDRRILEEIKDPLIHLVRNSIDHGIETQSERLKQGKAPRGTITISVSSRNGNAELAVRDDGLGIDVGRVREAAVRSKHLSREKARLLDDAAALRLVFQSGVSTSPMITDISGRGLGLAIVREKVERLSGTVSLETRPGVGTAFRMILPLTLARFRGVVVRTGARLFVLPTNNVERASRIRLTEIKSVENRETISLGGEAISLLRLDELLGGPRKSESRGKRDVQPVVVLAASGQRMAFLVDEILGEQEVLVKKMGKQLARVRNIAGATILGTGEVVPIINAADLLKSAVRMSETGPGGTAADAGLEEPKTRSVLVAEDSITSRTLLKSILESAGYRVETSVDGIDAFTKLRTGQFDLVVSDVDMPRMNGLGLTAKIRADKKLAELPVVLVTALESREDRERGIDVGANAYIVKSSFDQSNLLEVIKRLI